ncbi:hypothetical protein BKA66DRAFT_613187 [Pyrenochaeta sp. MPI-SDFR-AT-0127]|nr:hypothetical protein BKA66DRAFT_613187 [Pyrenochaeta sp. MPI-SDFR-AT-0127]
MKFFVLALQVIILVESVVGTRTPVQVTNLTHALHFDPLNDQDDQANLPTTTPLGIPYTTVTECGTAKSSTSCSTSTSICEYGSSTTLMSWLTSDCNWRTNPTEFPAPPLSCSNTRMTTSRGCYDTSVIWPDPVSAPTRSHLLVAGSPHATSTELGECC